jgi:hypothetical protein
MIRRSAILLSLVLASGGVGCTITDCLPCMCIPPYRDPPAGFSSTFYRYLYGHGSRAESELAKKDDSSERAADEESPNSDAQLLGHETPPASSKPSPPASNGWRPPFDMSFLRKRPEPVQF